MQNTNELVCDKDTGFSLIYETYHKRMHAYGIAMGFSHYLCHDAVQDVFFNLFISKNNLDNIENLEVYLLQCMKNRLFDIYRNEKKKLLIKDEELGNQYENECFIDKIIAEEKNELMNKEVNRLLQKLPTKQRKIVMCRFNYNLKFVEIAEVVNMTPDAVKKQLYRSIKFMEQKANASLVKYYNT